MPWRPPAQQGVTPQHRGRFAGYDVLAEADRWDDVTTGVVMARLAPTTDLSFFTMTENAIASPLCDLLLGQDAEPRVPVVALVDERLATGETDGWHYSDLPEDAEAWRLTLQHLDSDAEDAFSEPFSALDRSQQATLVQHVQDLANDKAHWHDLPAAQVWSLWTRYTSTAFYSHPWAWNEIGFGGPAYPRGYKSRSVGGRERWEVTDHDAHNPVPFAERVERARRAHTDMLGHHEPGT
jgi:hypothetical protein